MVKVFVKKRSGGRKSTGIPCLLSRIRFRWEFDVAHLPSELNQVADALSRLAAIPPKTFPKVLEEHRSRRRFAGEAGPTPGTPWGGLSHGHPWPFRGLCRRRHSVP